jgi:hypothetical protein
VPTFSEFYEIFIRMYFNDHAPPHFHARYGDLEATFSIEACAVLEGGLPGRALKLVEEWAIIHKEQLLVDWQLCQENTLPEKIEPLP